MNRTEFNVTTGERKVIDLTPQEEADALARTAAEAAKPKPTRVQSLEERVLIAKGLAPKADFDAEAAK